MAEATARRPFHVTPLMWLVCVVLVGSVGYGVATYVLSRPPAQPGVALVSRTIAFEDVEAGGVLVRDVASGRPIALLGPGEGGFIRSTLRALARERRGWNLGGDQPFRLTAWDDGRFTLHDEATGRTVDLKAFGPTNAEAFGRLLHARPMEGGQR
ncbi:MAG: photosynthetic complex assembly protein PuhC [Acetobacteraceae bacterium]|nr:photosynthetic complex assembly protein PuhC [Acetobacteraceae bacterium]MCX7683847.1 photosynthetic complex assembly protein PuhC [Acetobacteraceae bacterium]MDW8399621.1 photosynthetic complex assembly protein PuhC [Acetobacteraceae bacterium]